MLIGTGAGDRFDFYIGNVNMASQKVIWTTSALTFNFAQDDIDSIFKGDNDANLLYVNAGTDKVGVGNANPTEKLTVEGAVSASGGIYGGEGTTQTTGSYDFPGAIMGYSSIGVNAADSSYSLTNSYAVPDSDMYVTFVAPKSGIVEIEVQVYVDAGSSGAGDLFFGLSDNATYNAVQTYYEVDVLGPPRYDHNVVVNKWTVSGLTGGTTYKYWLGAKIDNTAGTPTLKWGGNASGEYPPFIMKVTALPSNTRTS